MSCKQNGSKPNAEYVVYSNGAVSTVGQFEASYAVYSRAVSKTGPSLTLSMWFTLMEL